MKNSVEEPQKLKLKLPSDPAIPFPGAYPKEMKAGSQLDTCTPRVIAPFITKPGGGGEPECPFNRWMDKQNVVYTYTGKLFNLKKKEDLPYATKWVNPEDSVKWNKPVPKGQILCHSTYELSKVVKPMETESRMVNAWREGRLQSCSIGTEFQFCKMKKFSSVT